MTSLIIESTNQQGIKKQKTIPYIDKSATNEKLIAFAQGINNLTNNTYESTTLVDRKELDTDSKPARTFNGILCRISNKTITTTLVDGVYEGTIELATLTSAGFFTVQFAGTFADSEHIFPEWVDKNASAQTNYLIWHKTNFLQMRLTPYNASQAQVIEGSFVWPESQYFQAQEVKFKFTVTDGGEG